MIGPAGMLVLLIVGSSPPETAAVAWVTDETAVVHASAVEQEFSAETSMRRSNDARVVAAALQQLELFREDAPAVAPAPEPGAIPPGMLPPGMLPDDVGADEVPSPADDDPAAGADGPFEDEGSPFREEDELEFLNEFSSGGCSESGCGGCGQCDGCDGLIGRCGQPWWRSICFESWIAQGATLNTHSPRNRSNYPVAFNDRSNDYQMNQFYLLLERAADSDGYCWDVGGRVDLLYGTDSAFTTARGLESDGDFSPKWNSRRYGLTMPQAYLEIASPWRNGLSAKIGRFYTLLGYEGVPAVDNFFYSHSYSMLYGEPFTHTGALCSAKLGTITFHGGITRGWDNWEDNNNDFAALAGADWTSCDGRTAIAFAMHLGRERDEPPGSTDLLTAWSLVVQQRLSRRLQYVAQWDYAVDERGGVDSNDAKWYGLNQYLFYTINPCWKAGLRYEWFWDEDGMRVDPGRHRGDYMAWTVGLNYTPNDHVTVRPEVRVDRVDTAGYTPYADGRRGDQTVLACDLIYRF